MAFTSTERQRRWRDKKRDADIAAGLRPPKRKRRKRPKSAAEVQRDYRLRCKAKDAAADRAKKAQERAAKYAPSRERRRLSRSAPAIEPEFRLGDCRKVLHDIADESVALVLTDSPWGKDFEWCYEWLSEFATRVLNPGGSLICYVGATEYEYAFDTLRRHLEFVLPVSTPLTQPVTLHGKYEARIEARPVIWVSKGPYRKLRRVLPTLPRSSGPDKSLFGWQQGDAVWQLVEPLTEPRDLIVDPFCGSRGWGYICGGLGRQWIGSDIVDRWRGQEPPAWWRQHLQLVGLTPSPEADRPVENE